MKAKICIFLGLIVMLGTSRLALAHGDAKITASPSAKRAIYREITPNAGPMVVDGADVFLRADFIWWKAKQAGMEYAATGELVTASQIFTPLSKGDIAQLKYHWDPGFKVGLGLNLWHDGWDVYAAYTYLHSHGSDSISRTNQVVPFLPLSSAVTSGSPSTVDRATSRSDLHFNVIDLELGRSFYVSQFLILRPHIGLKGTWQSQDWTTRYFGSNLQISVNGTQQLTGPYRMRHHNRYYGVGVRGGLNTAWHFTINWSVFGDLAWTAMWSDYCLKRKDKLSDINRGQSQDTIRTRFSFYDLKFIGEFQIGLRWETGLCEDSYHIQVQAGWEEQVWINHQTFINPTFTAPYFDLTLHGLTLMVRFDF